MENEIETDSSFAHPARDKTMAPGVPGLLPRFVRTGLVAGVLFVSAVAGAQNAGEPARATRDAAAAEVTAAEAGGQSIETGHVRFSVSRDGRWTSFTPAWTGGVSLFSSGGFVFFASRPGDSADGRVVEPVRSAGGGPGVVEDASAIEKCSEGTAGGLRAPAPAPDDDRDGRVDEDWLDGADNDGDGKIDEDFAAIGDQMIAVSYRTRGGAGDSSDGPRLAFQHEAYAWSLPHIDGTVMVSLRVWNVGTEPLEDIRIGAFFQKDGPFTLAAERVSPPKSAATPNTSQLLSCQDAAGTTIGLVAFPVLEGEGAWTGGHSSAEDAWDEALAVELSATPTPASVADGGGPAPTNTRVEDSATVYALSPMLGSLAPGDGVRVDLALVAVGRSQDVAAAAAIAYETFLGDGTNRYLPPPVSMTPRVIWGTYRHADAIESGAAGIVIGIEPLGDEPVTVGDVSYFSGLASGAVARQELQPGVEQLVIRSGAIEELALKGKRINLKGRLDNGEFFELILRPEEGAGGVSGSRNGAGPEAELYWKTEGRLSQDLLNSSPNPFRDVTTISYEVPSMIEMEDGTLIQSTESLDTSVKVYNVVGRLVSVLAEDLLGPGVHMTDWRAVDDNGNPVASGVYYVKLQVGKRYITKRLILLK